MSNVNYVQLIIAVKILFDNVSQSVASDNIVMAHYDVLFSIVLSAEWPIFHQEGHIISIISRIRNS